MSIAYDFKGISIPLYPRIINYGIKSFKISSDLIDVLPSSSREWDKVDILASDLDYLSFLSKITGVVNERIVGFLNDFKNDGEFRKEFSKKLSELESSGIKAAGDLRFHSLSIYCIVRAAKPALMVETGVAQGKSSTLALLAMHHNKKGKLISIDFPNPKGNTLADGAVTSTEGKEIGWLAPSYLRTRWELHLGDARKLLPDIFKIKANKKIDIFFHDSLHTYEHARFEFETAAQHIKKGIILCDNIELGVGKAFQEYLDTTVNVGHAYRDFAGVRI
jgi:predicted O-methyltransferase YrrM